MSRGIRLCQEDLFRTLCDAVSIRKSHTVPHSCQHSRHVEIEAPKLKNVRADETIASTYTISTDFILEVHLGLPRGAQRQSLKGKTIQLHDLEQNEPGTQVETAVDMQGTFMLTPTLEVNKVVKIVAIKYWN